jgi:hypothetical protein
MVFLGFRTRGSAELVQRDGFPFPAGPVIELGVRGVGRCAPGNDFGVAQALHVEGELDQAQARGDHEERVERFGGGGEKGKKKANCQAGVEHCFFHGQNPFLKTWKD